MLGRIVTTADPELAGLLPSSDDAVRAPLRSVACAVHAKGKTALEVATLICRAASAALPTQLDDAVPALRLALERRNGRRFGVVIDALDEAHSTLEARRIVSSLVVPIVQTCHDVGAQVVVGTRRADGDGDLVGHFGAARHVVDLDDPTYFSIDDLVEYALGHLAAGRRRARRQPLHR